MLVIIWEWEQEELEDLFLIHIKKKVLENHTQCMEKMDLEDHYKEINKLMGI